MPFVVVLACVNINRGSGPICSIVEAIVFVVAVDVGVLPLVLMTLALCGEFSRLARWCSIFLR